MALNWIVSYPKSGNTWVRIFLQTYLTGAVPNFKESLGIPSDGTPVFHDIGTKKEYGELGWAIRRLAAIHRMEEVLFFPKIVKSHAPFAKVKGIPLFPQGCINKVLYIYRDPKDILISYSDHLGLSLEMTEAVMKGEHAWSMGDTPHFQGSWANHYRSWRDAWAHDVPVFFVSYEELSREPELAFVDIVNWFGFPYDLDAIRRTVKLVAFNNLRQHEADDGFKELSPNSKAKKFFRSGKIGSWKDVLEYPPDFGEVAVELGYA